jgi:putative addiction module CopG family antidote
MNVKISGDAELFVREEVASGRYDSPQEVVQEGLRLLHEREHDGTRALSGLQIDSIR